MISSIHIRYKTIVYTSTLVLIMLDNEGQDLLNFILSQQYLSSNLLAPEIYFLVGCCVVAPSEYKYKYTIIIFIAV